MSYSGHSDNNHVKTEGLNNNRLTACDIKLDKPGNNTIDLPLARQLELSDLFEENLLAECLTVEMFVKKYIGNWRKLYHFLQLTVLTDF